MGTIKILIADDEVVIADIMAKKVREAGFEVMVTYDGQLAWEQIQVFKPDVIVLDLTMPGMDGWEVLKNLRANSPSKQWIPVIIVSANTEFEHIQQGITLEADHYLTKPCKVEDVIKSIRLMLNLAAQRNV